MQYELSVVIPVFNSAKVLEHQLEALSSQHDAPNFEVLVCDNGSSDNLQDVLRHWKTRLPGLTYVLANQKKGAGHARNLGVQEALAEKVAFCDADDIVGKFWATNAEKALNQFEFVTGGAHTVFDDALSQLTVSEIQENTFKALGFPQNGVYHPTELGSLAPVLLGGNFAARKSSFLKLGGFDTDFVSGSEDNDLSYRIMRQGIQLYTYPAMTITYRIRSGDWALLKRGYNTGFTFAGLCAKHDAWELAVPYRNFTALTPLKNLVKFLLHLPSSSRQEKVTELSTFLTSLGLLYGRYKFKKTKRTSTDCL